MSQRVRVVETEKQWEVLLAEANACLRRGEADIARYEANGQTVFAEMTRKNVEALRKEVEIACQERAAALASMPRCQCGGTRQ